MAKKILLAEDSVTMQKVVEMTFSAEGYTVTAVSSAEAAIAQAKEVKPDIVIADLSMEGKTGYEVCSAVKADPATARIPVLLLHGTAAPYDEAKARAARADGEIVKPFETQALIDKVRTLIEKAPAAAREPMRPAESIAPPLTAGPDIVIDDNALAAQPEVPARAAPPPKPAPGPAKPAPVAKPAPPPPAAPPVVKPKPPEPPTAIKPVPKPAMPSLAAKAPVSAPAAKPLAAALRPPSSARTEAVETEITIEAEPPPRGAGQVAWDRFDVPVPAEASKSRKSDSTLIGLGKPPTLPAARPDVLPPPPAGMPLPHLASKAPSAPASSEPLDPAAYEAIAKLSREIIERIVWEVVPDLAERIIREELDRLVEKRRS